MTNAKITVVFRYVFDRGVREDSSEVKSYKNKFAVRLSWLFWDWLSKVNMRADLLICGATCWLSISLWIWLTSVAFIWKISKLLDFKMSSKASEEKNQKWLIFMLKITSSFLPIWDCCKSSLNCLISFAISKSGLENVWRLIPIAIIS